MDDVYNESMRDIISEIRQDLENRVDNEYRQGATKYFREEVNIMGVRTPDVRKVARMYFPIVSDMPKKDLFVICEKLLASPYFEEITIGLDWLARLKNTYKKSDFAKFKKWLKKYIKNWAHCDDFCSHSLGIMLDKYPILLDEVIQRWSVSKNRWFRRASAVSLIYVIRRDEKLSEVFKVSDKLIKDEDDLVRKGVGWLLRETWERYPSDVYRYLEKNKDKLARVTLRYAIEKMNKGQKAAMMKK